LGVDQLTRKKEVRRIKEEVDRVDRVDNGWR
jgi:hypothetical protein